MPKDKGRIEIEITRSTSVDGEDVEVGDVLEVTASTAKLLMGIDKAVRHRKKGEDSERPNIEIYDIDALDKMDMNELRVIGDAYGVKDNKKDDLIVKILEAQEANGS